MSVATPTTPMSRAEIEYRLTEIQAELDEIGPTFGMQNRRNELGSERDRLLDRLNEIIKG